MEVWYVKRIELPESQSQEVVVSVRNAETVPLITGGAVWWEKFDDPAEGLGYYLAYTPEGYNFSILVKAFLDHSAKAKKPAGEKHVVVDAREVFKPLFS